MAAALLGMVVALDLLWGSLTESTGSLVYGLVDEPAHLATCALAILAVATVTGVRPPGRFVAAALVASVAIDLDHLPGYLGSQLFGGDLPRPGTHGLLLVLALLALLAALKPGPGRQITLGVAFGVSAHLLRDLATGPGVPMFWPVSDSVATIPYAFFVAFLALGVVAIALPRRALAAGRVAAVALTLALGASVFAAEPAEATPEVGVGAYISGADQNPFLIDDFSAEVGRPLSFLISYKAWSQVPLVHDQLDGIWDHGAIPMITWEPWEQSLSGIARGEYDSYVWDAAQAAAAWDKPVMIRFGQEMNGDWFPWGGQPHAFKAAWRHLVRVFRAAGADKVRWVWTPYVNSRAGRLPFAPFFPGNRWVDWVGLDVINWGGPYLWRTFGQILGRSYHDLIKLSSKPVIIAETGSGEQGGSKAQWLSTMLRRNIPDMRHVRAVAFWSAADPRGDLRVDSSPDSLAAVRHGLSKPLYKSSRWRLLRTPARLGR